MLKSIKSKIPFIFLISISLFYAHNKLLKSDSQRVAFLACVGFSDFGVMQRLGHCVAHTLARRYFRNGSLRLNVYACSVGVKMAG